MAKKTSYQLSEQQKRDHKRLTQLANRRIKAFAKLYEKDGLEIIPHEVSGGIQHKEQWHTPKTPISRSIKYDNKQEYDKHMRWLRTFDVPEIRQTVTDYEKTQRTKIIQGVKTSIGDISAAQQTLLENMSITERTKFWNNFSRIATKMGIHYSSDAAMAQTLDLYKEDIQSIIDRSL